MDKIDVFFYINLAHRTDRKQHIEAELAKANVPESKIVRIDAIKVQGKKGNFGCTLSHIKTFEQFLDNPKWKTAMVLEDDFLFVDNSADTINERIANVFDSFPDWDCISLSYNQQRYSILDTHVSHIKKALMTITTSGYIIRKPYVTKLLRNWQACAELYAREGDFTHTCCDVTWNILKPHSNWYITVPAIGHQCDGYSDIESQHVSYRC